MPTREELTIAWGDSILAGLRPGVKVYLSSGRFVGVDDGGSHLCRPRQGPADPGRDQPGRGGGEPWPPTSGDRCRCGWFSTRQLRAGGRVGPADRARTCDDPTDIDLDDLIDAPGAVLSPEQRLLEAFPGAEEVSP